MVLLNDPFRDFDEMLGRMSGGRARGGGQMPMDAYRRGDDVWVHLDVPGVSADSIDVDLERNVLSVTAAREWTIEEGDQLYVNERRQGTFSRQVHLGDGLDAEGIEANYRDGVLTLRIPVAEKAQPRKIAVRGRSEVIDVDAGD